MVVETILVRSCFLYVVLRNYFDDSNSKRILFVSIICDLLESFRFHSMFPSKTSISRLITITVSLVRFSFLKKCCAFLSVRSDGPFVFILDEHNYFQLPTQTFLQTKLFNNSASSSISKIKLKQWLLQFA